MSMIDKHLIAKTNSIANDENIVFWKSYRITILTDSLFRIEKDLGSGFTDEATQSIWHRNMEKNNFKYNIFDDKIQIITKTSELHLRFNIEDSYVVLNGQQILLNNKENLLGTARTLDEFDGDICIYDIGEYKKGDRLKLSYGVASKNGVSIIDDSRSLKLVDGVLKERSNAFDIYVFVYGKRYREAVKALYKISGTPPVLPKYALGNWWSRYFRYTDKEYLKVLNRFIQNNVPLTIATIDMDWHYAYDIDEVFEITKQKLDSEYYGGADGWTGYTWNKRLFPDYKNFLNNIRNKGLNITLNLHPAGGIRWFESQYEEFALAMGIDPLTKKHIPFDMTDPKFINNYFKLLHKPYEKDGVDFWWIDWQQGTKTKFHNLDPLWSLNHYHYLDNALHNRHPLILSRYSGVGSHRYPVGFSGDTYITWDTLKYLPYFTMTASNIGYTWWSHDIGGHHKGYNDEELFVRSIQFGVFNPIMRLHSTKNDALSKEPWRYKNGHGMIAMEYLRLRHQLIPFLHSASFRNTLEGLALVEPMYYEYPDNKIAYDLPNQYLFGQNLIVAPIYSKSKQGYSKIKVWLPKAEAWTDIFTGETYEGNKTHIMYRSLDSIPVLAKPGTIIPISNDILKNGVSIPEDLLIKVFVGDGSYLFYEADEKEINKIDFVAKHENNKQSLEIMINSSNPNYFKNRNLTVEFSNLYDGHIIVESDISTNHKELITDHPTIVLKDLNIHTKYKISVSYTKESKLDYLKRNAILIIQRQNEYNSDKESTLGKLLESKSVEEFKEISTSSNLTKMTIKKIIETI